MKCSLRKIISLLLTVYISCSLWGVYIVFLEKKPTTGSNSTKKIINIGENHKVSQLKMNERKPFHRMINIWGKAAIAEYLWVHIFEGTLSQVPGYLLYKGTIIIENIKISYTTGPSLIAGTADTSIKDLIIIVNGRDQSKVKAAKVWLDVLVNKERFNQLRNLGLVLLGNELCENEWLWYYIDNFSMLIKFVFIVYDASVIDTRQVYQWPLGVATYRNFPLITKININIYSKRKYRCNFLGTIYANSSRELLMGLLKANTYNCFVKARYIWLEKESKESRSIYHDVLQNSDLTLCPVGINSESYRIYEALSYGSVPVLEDIMTPGQCGKDKIDRNPPYLLLKKYKAPVIYIKDWHELPDLLQKEDLLSHRDVIRRRKKILDWYELFRYKMREELLRVTLSNFEY